MHLLVNLQAFILKGIHRFNSYVLTAALAYASNLSKTTRPRDMLFFEKIPYLWRMKTCSKHANLSVRLFARDITREVPPPKV